MSFALGGLAVMSGSRPLASLFARLLAVVEVRSVFFGVLVFIVVLILAYLTNPSETSFRAFLTEQSFRLHLSKLDDLDTQDESSLSGQNLSARKEQNSRWGPGLPPKYHYIDASSSSIAFANRASVSLRTPKHLFRSFGIMSIAAVLPVSSSKGFALKRGNDAKAARDDGEGGGNEDASLVAESWFFGVFGMWFWMINLNFESFWREAGIITKDDLDGTVSGVLEIKNLDRSKEASQNSCAPNTSHKNVNGHSNHAQQHSQHPVPKGRSRERFASQNGHANGNRSTTPPPLPKSVSLPLHTKRGTLPATPEKSLHSNGSAFSSSRSPPVSQLVLPLTSESRIASTISSPVTVPPAAISRSPSAQFKSLPAIAELERQIEASKKANDDLRSQINDFKRQSDSGRTLLREEVEKQRARKRAEDTAKGELKSRTKALEDQKRNAESTRREADKRLKVARAACDGAEARTERLEHEIRELHVRMEAQGAAIVASGVEAGALAEELSQQVERRKRAVKESEEEVAALALRLREMEEKVAEEQKRLEVANKEAEERRDKREMEREFAQNQGLVREHTLSLPTKPNAGVWHAVPSLQTTVVDSMSFERSDGFPPSPIAHATPESPLSIAPPELLVRRASIPSVLPVPIPVQNHPSNSTLTGNTASGFSVFSPDFSTSLRPPRQLGRNVTAFSPFNDMPASPGLLTIPSPLSPSSESLIPSSLYESLGMASGGLSPASADMDRHLSRSFQSDDDVILDRDWLARRNRSAGDVGAPIPAPGTAETSPISPSGSVGGDFAEFDPFDSRLPVHDHFASLRMDTQRATFAHRPFTSELALPQVSSEPRAPPEENARRSAWFSKDKEKNKDNKDKDKRHSKLKEKKGLNPDAKEFSLSKDKERSFFASLGHNRGTSTPNSGSGSSTTPSTASSITTPELNLSAFPSNSSISVSPPSVSAKPVPSLFGIGSSWFGSSRAFAPTPTEREQLARVLGGSSNASLDHLSNMGDVKSLPNSPQPMFALAQPMPPVHLSDLSKRPHFWMTGGLKSNFNPFTDEGESGVVGVKKTGGEEKAGSA